MRAFMRQNMSDLQALSPLRQAGSAHGVNAVGLYCVPARYEASIS